MAQKTAAPAAKTATAGAILIFSLVPPFRHLHQRLYPITWGWYTWLCGWMQLRRVPATAAKAAAAAGAAAATAAATIALVS